ncbi:MAG: methyltransferase domain-containing protein [Sumerlaeia bacterium]
MQSVLNQMDTANARAPGHWVLARLGKRVLRPGGLEATTRLLTALAPSSSDDIVEFAPGLGLTARRLIAASPASYTAVERDEGAAARLASALSTPSVRIVNGCAEASGLPSASFDLVVGEAMLTMQRLETKRAIVGEAARLLRPGGRYGIHEIALTPDSINDSVRQSVRAAMSHAVHHGVNPQTVAEWRDLLTQAGFTNLRVELVPFRLLEPARLIADEGVAGAARFAMNMLRHPDARRRVLAMRRTFRQQIGHLTAIIITAQKG